jgi:hypothetical protein
MVSMWMPFLAQACRLTAAQAGSCTKQRCGGGRRPGSSQATRAGRQQRQLAGSSATLPSRLCHVLLALQPQAGAAPAGARQPSGWRACCCRKPTAGLVHRARGAVAWHEFVEHALHPLMYYAFVPLADAPADCAKGSTLLQGWLVHACAVVAVPARSGTSACS